MLLPLLFVFQEPHPVFSFHTLLFQLHLPVLFNPFGHPRRLLQLLRLQLRLPLGLRRLLLPPLLKLLQLDLCIPVLPFKLLPLLSEEFLFLLLGLFNQQLLLFSLLLSDQLLLFSLLLEQLGAFPVPLLHFDSPRFDPPLFFLGFPLLFDLEFALGLLPLQFFFFDFPQAALFLLEVLLLGGVFFALSLLAGLKLCLLFFLGG